MNHVKAVVTDGLGDFRTENVDIGQPNVKEVLVKVQAALVTLQDWKMLRSEQGMIMGYEGLGQIVKVGPEVDRLRAGDQVIFHRQPACGKCKACHGGRPIACENYSFLGYTKGRKCKAHPASAKLDGEPIDKMYNIGAFSEMTIVRKECIHQVEGDVVLEHGALWYSWLKANALIRKIQKEVGQGDLLILGANRMANLIIQVAKIHGFKKIMVVDQSSERLSIAQQSGATHLFQPYDHDKELVQLDNKVLKETKKQGSNVCIVCEQNVGYFEAALRMLSVDGLILNLHPWTESTLLDSAVSLANKSIQCQSIIPVDWHKDVMEVTSCWQQNKLRTAHLSIMKYDLESIGQAYSNMLTGKALVNWIDFS